MAKKGKLMVALATGAGVFVDGETGFKVVPGKAVELDKMTAGTQTLSAYQNKHLVDADESEEENDDSDLPKELPGRDVFKAAGKNFDWVKNFDFEKDKFPGIGLKTVEQLREYAKNYSAK